MPDPLTTLDAARRQLVTAIRLLFADRDAVSIYTLATNAQEILSALCEKHGVRSLRANFARPAGMSDAEVQSTLINPARNFFKHADRDPDAQWQDFRDEDCDHILLIPCFDIVELQGKSPIEAQVFLTWYAALYPNKIPPGSDLQRAALRKFPHLKPLARVDQKRRAQDMLETAMNHKALMEHPETDTRELHLWS
jgi:hypothetical protein